MNIQLNRKQLATLMELYISNPDALNFVLERNGISGIGYSVAVSFVSKDNIKTIVDITDLGAW